MRKAFLLFTALLAACASPDGPKDSGGNENGNNNNNNNNVVVFSEQLTYVAVNANSPCVGQPYARQFSALGGTPPYTWKLSAGTLPAGLTLSASGLLTGTPTATTTANYSVTVTDSKGAIASGGITSTPVNGCVFPFYFGAVALTAVGVGGDAAYLPFIQGGTPPYTFTATGLPPGLSIDASTGMITGRATTAGFYNVTVKACESKGTCMNASAAVVALAPGAALAGTNKFDGTWIGQFNEQYEMCPNTYYHSAGENSCSRLDNVGNVQKTALITGAYTFNVTIKASQIGPSVLGIAVLQVSNASVSDPRLGCSVSGCALIIGTLTLNDPPLNISTQAVGLVLATNAWTLTTSNNAGDAHMNSLGWTISNSLDPAIRTSNWGIAMNNGLLEDLVITDWKTAGYKKITAKSWILARSSL